MTLFLVVALFFYLGALLAVPLVSSGFLAYELWQELYGNPEERLERLLTEADGPEENYCPHCGARVSEEDVICPRCLNELKFNCPHCGSPLRLGEDGLRCPHCGRPLPSHHKREEAKHFSHSWEEPRKH